MPQQKNPFDAVYERPAQTPAMDTGAPASGGNPFDGIYGGASPRATATPPAPTAPVDAPASGGGNPFDAAYGGAASSTGAAQPASGTDPNAPWYSRAWDWSNKPIADFHREGAGP